MKQNLKEGEPRSYDQSLQLCCFGEGRWFSDRKQTICKIHDNKLHFKILWCFNWLAIAIILKVLSCWLALLRWGEWFITNKKSYFLLHLILLIFHTKKTKPCSCWAILVTWDYVENFGDDKFEKKITFRFNFDARLAVFPSPRDLSLGLLLHSTVVIIWPICYYFGMITLNKGSSAHGKREMGHRVSLLDLTDSQYHAYLPSLWSSQRCVTRRKDCTRSRSFDDEGDNTNEQSNCSAERLKLDRLYVYFSW